MPNWIKSGRRVGRSAVFGGITDGKSGSGISESSAADAVSGIFGMRSIPDEIVLIADGEEQSLTGEQAAELVTAQPDMVSIEKLPDGQERIVLYEIKGSDRGELFGDSNEARSPQFRVLDNEQARKDFDLLTVKALKQLGFGDVEA